VFAGVSQRPHPMSQNECTRHYEETPLYWDRLLANLRNEDSLWTKETGPTGGPENDLELRIGLLTSPSRFRLGTHAGGGSAMDDEASQALLLRSVECARESR